MAYYKDQVQDPVPIASAPNPVASAFPEGIWEEEEDNAPVPAQRLAAVEQGGLLSVAPTAGSQRTASSDGGSSDSSNPSSILV